MPRAAILPTDVQSLQALLRTAHGAIEAMSALRSRDVLIENLKLQLARLKRMKFGRSSEQLDAQIAQLEFSLEELEGNAGAAPVLPVVATPPPARQSTRKPLPDHLPRERQVHEPHTGACTYPKCGGTLRVLGEDVSEVLEYVPEHWKVLKHVRPKYSCSDCQRIVQAHAPSRPIERSYAGPGLLAHVLVAKYCDHLPFYRQSQIYARDGVDLDRATLADWGGAASALIDPLLGALSDYVMSAYKLHADDAYGLSHAARSALRRRGKEKSPDAVKRRGLSLYESLAVTYSGMATATLPSAQSIFTSEFEMGSGGSCSLWPPGKTGRFFSIDAGRVR